MQAYGPALVFWVGLSVIALGLHSVTAAGVVLVVAGVVSMLIDAGGY